MYPRIQIGDIQIVTFSVVMLLDFYICFAVILAEKRTQFHGIEKMQKIIVWTILGIGLGGRLASAISLTVQGKDSFIYNLVYGGSVFYGGLLGGTFLTYLACRKYQQRFLKIADTFAGVIPLGQAIGRVGCYFNGCCYGKEYSGLFSVRYVVEQKESQVFPTWFVESVFCAVLFLVFQIKKRDSKEGEISAFYLMAYALFRFMIEFLRGDEIRGEIGGMSTSQVMSIVVFGIGIFILILKDAKKMCEGRKER